MSAQGQFLCVYRKQQLSQYGGRGLLSEFHSSSGVNGIDGRHVGDTILASHPSCNGLRILASTLDCRNKGFELVSISHVPFTIDLLRLALTRRLVLDRDIMVELR